MAKSDCGLSANSGATKMQISQKEWYERWEKAFGTPCNVCGGNGYLVDMDRGGEIKTRCIVCKGFGRVKHEY